MISACNCQNYFSSINRIHPFTISLEATIQCGIIFILSSAMSGPGSGILLSRECSSHVTTSNVRADIQKYVVSWFKHSWESNRPVPRPICVCRGSKRQTRFFAHQKSVIIFCRSSRFLNIVILCEPSPRYIGGC